MNMLEVCGLSVSYGGINAVKGIDLEIAAGELVCLIGTNGAGKTTTLKALSRMLPARGKILYQGKSISQLPVYEMVRQGIALVPEGRGIFGRLSVEENLLMGAYIRNDMPAIRRDLDRAYHLFPRLFERKIQQAGTLSGGEQQMLAIARALMSRPQLLFLDEPSMGLAPLMVQKIFDTIRSISADGVTILLVEQNARLALEISHRGYVMEGGTIVLADTSASLLSSPQVRQAYLGE